MPANAIAAHWKHWLTWAALWGVLSAIGYTLANVFLRKAAGADPFLVTAVKTAPTSALALPWLFALRHRRLPLFPAKAGLGWLFAAALLGQIGGNVAFQWSLHVIGMALAVPLSMGCLIFSSALLGQNLLGERAGWLNIFALAIVAASIGVLTCGAQSASDAVAGTAQPLAVVAAGAAAACISGASYAVLGAAIRNTVSRGTPIPTSLLIVSATGVVVIGLVAAMRLGEEPLPDITPMVLAGVWNALAFVALTKCLKTAPLYYTNALNASQIAMASVVGVLLFHEAATVHLFAGVMLTIVGLLLIRND